MSGPPPRPVPTLTEVLDVQAWSDQAVPPLPAPLNVLDFELDIGPPSAPTATPALHSPDPTELRQRLKDELVPAFEDLLQRELGVALAVALNRVGVELAHGLLLQLRPQLQLMVEQALNTALEQRLDC